MARRLKALRRSGEHPQSQLQLMVHPIWQSTTSHSVESPVERLEKPVGSAMSAKNRRLFI